MTILSVALVENGDKVQISKDKVVSLVVSQKGDQSYKFDATFSKSSLIDLYSNHIKKAVAEVLSGINFSVVTLSTNASVHQDPTLGGESSLLGYTIKDVFSLGQKSVNQSQFLVSVSMVQIANNGKRTDLISPHDRKITVQNSKQGLYVEGLSRVVCSTADDLIRICEDGFQVQSALKLTPSLSCVLVHVLQRPIGNNRTVSTSSTLKFVNFSAEKSNIMGVSTLFTEISQKKGKLNKSNASDIEEMFLGSLLGNNNSCLLANVDGRDVEVTKAVLSSVASLSGLGSSAAVNHNDAEVQMKQIRNQISTVRNRISSRSPPSKDDLSLMERLMSDLDEIKKSGWDQVVMRSDQFYEERKVIFANKGLTWILESTKRADRENIKRLQSLMNTLTSEYKTQRQITDRLNTDLKQKIDNYTHLVNSGNPDDKTKKSHVAIISDLKEQYQRENEKLKDVKNKLKDTQSKLQSERQSGYAESSSNFDVAFEAMKEEREKTRQENEQLIDEEVEKIKTEIEQEKSDLQMRFSSNSLVRSEDEVLRNMTELAQLRLEKSVMTTQLDVLRKERVQAEEHMNVLLEKHNRELEIQQLQNLQTFRAYREVFEEYKVELENRWRSLLDDAVQDAVFLNSRNAELMEEQAKLKLEIAKFKDDRSIGKASMANL